MAQVFHRSSNAISRVSVFGGSFGLVGGLLLLGVVQRSPYVTRQGVVRSQPVPFSHAHHVSDIGIDCRYCHTSVEEAASAGMPSSKVCMSCHSILWDRAEMLEPVRESYRSDRPIAWTRVHDLPDFVYFDHSIHLAKGVGCSSCHGPVGEMPLVWRTNTLYMEWCLGCHRDPVGSVRPRERVFDPGWTPSLSRAEQVELVARYGVAPRVDCWTCHR